MTHGNAFRDHSRKALVNRVRVRQPDQRGAGRYWLFTFTDAWGPCLCDEWGEPVDNTPLADEQHPFWTQFEAWLAPFDRSLGRPLPVKNGANSPAAGRASLATPYAPNPPPGEGEPA